MYESYNFNNALEIVGEVLARFFMSLLVTSLDFKIGSENTSFSSALSLPVSSSENSLKSMLYN